MRTAHVADWGFAVDANGALLVGGASAEQLAREYGTPLHVIDEAGVERQARRIVAAFAEAYPGESRVHFAMKCNDTPGVAALAIGAGLRVEVGTPYEWWLARRLGVSPAEIVVNGPLKGPLLDSAFRDGAGLVVLDGLDEMDLAVQAARRFRAEPRVLLRVNPDCVPRGMNRATATGSRKLSMFGFDLASGEVDQAFARLASGGPLKYAGLHCHVGSGIHRPRDYERPLQRLVDCAARAARVGLTTEVLDIGGGIGVGTSREMTTREYVLYHAFGRLPPPCNPSGFPRVEEFAATISRAITAACARHALPLPTLLLEPGRSVVSSAGVLLVGVGRIKHRQGVGTWAIADGGAGTVAFPLFYELHEVLHCRAPEALPTHRYDLVGGACFSADWIYRGKKLPELRTGDVLAICDSGAYFSVQEANFGFPHPPIVGVRDGNARVLRRRESFEDMVSRDVVPAADQRPARTPAPELRFRRLSVADLESAVAVFERAFRDHELYGPALGLARTNFGTYFRTLMALALADKRSVVLGAEWRGCLEAVLIAAQPGFPTLWGGLRHLREFAAAAGWAGLVQYLRFSSQWERFMRRPECERQLEFRGLWLAADRGASGRRAGAFLMRAACDYSRRLGYPLQTAVVDGANKPLIAYYERYGFRAAAAPPFLGGRAVLLEHRS